MCEPAGTWWPGWRWREPYHRVLLSCQSAQVSISALFKFPEAAVGNGHECTHTPDKHIDTDAWRSIAVAYRYLCHQGTLNWHMRLYPKRLTVFHAVFSAEIPTYIPRASSVFPSTRRGGGASESHGGCRGGAGMVKRFLFPRQPVLAL